MKTIRVILLAILIALLTTVSSFQFVHADDEEEKTITIVNKSSSDRVVTLKADSPLTEKYKFNVERYSTEAFKIDEDKYEISYVQCASNDDATDIVTVDVNMVDHNYTLTIYDCAHVPTKLQVKSHLAEEISLELYGYDDYTKDIQPGKNSERIYSGTYSYSYEACEGKTFTGEIEVLKNGISNFIIHSCEWFTSPAQVYGGPNPVGFKIVNHASFPVIMTLIGPDSYLVTADYGVNRFDLVTGTYKFNYYQDLQLKTGSFVVTPNGMGVLVITPSFTIGLVDDEVLE